MKYSQLLGGIAVIALIATCFMPWSFVESKQIVITGMSTRGTEFGKPGLMNIYLGVASLVLFMIPKVWAKRTNLFIAAVNIAWSVRNYLLVTTCFFGDCPQKKAGIFLLLLCSAVILIMAFLPKLSISANT